MLRMARLSTFVFLAVLFAIPLYATTALEMSTADLAQQSDLIVIGKVTGVSSRWADSRNLVTDATIEVSEVLKGEAGEVVTVTLPGGADANRPVPIAMSYPAAPQLHSGENAFLFLVRGDNDELVIAGWSQGKYSIITSEGEQYVTRDLTELRLTTGEGAVRGGTASKHSLKEFKNDVAAAMAGN